jgi:hypothetical protein
MHFFLHWLGLDSASGTPYLAWSGILSDIAEVAVVGGLISIYRRHNCTVHRCWRIGRHPVAGTPFVTCRKHHPDDHVTHQDVTDAHHAAIRASSGETGERVQQRARGEGQ